MRRINTFFALGFAAAFGLFVVGCENAAPEKTAPTAASAKASSDTPAALPVVSAALPKPIDMGPLPVPADPAVLVPMPPEIAGSNAAPQPSAKGSANIRPTTTTSPGPMAPRTPPTM